MKRRPNHGRPAWRRDQWRELGVARRVLRERPRGRALLHRDVERIVRLHSASMPLGRLTAQATLVHAGAFLTSAVEAVATHVLRACALEVLVGDRLPLVAKLLDGLVE